MNGKVVELVPTFFLDESWKVTQPLKQKTSFKTLGLGEGQEVKGEEQELIDWIESIKIQVAAAADTSIIGSDDKVEYLKSEVGMNIIVPKGHIKELRFQVTLKGDGNITNEVVAVDGFPKDLIVEKDIVSGKIKVGITKLFKFVPTPAGLLSDLLEVDLNPFEFKIGGMRRVDIDFGGGLTYEPEWYFRSSGIKNDLRVVLTIRKPRSVKNVEGDIKAAWIYDPGFVGSVKIKADSKSVSIFRTE